MCKYGVVTCTILNGNVATLDVTDQPDEHLLNITEVNERIFASAATPHRNPVPLPAAWWRPWVETMLRDRLPDIGIAVAVNCDINMLAINIHTRLQDLSQIGYILGACYQGS